MMRSSSRLVAIFVAGVVTALAAPAVARSVTDFARFARDAHRVDGFHAVGAGTGAAERGRRLVATNRAGRLPDDIIRVAPDAALLGGERPVEYEETPCEVGIVTARALVPSSIGSDYQSIEGAVYRDTTGGAPGIAPRHGCILLPVAARRVTTGVYDVDFLSNFPGTDSCPPVSYETLVTVKSPSVTPLIANTSTLCDERSRAVEQVRVYGIDGSPRDADFTIVLLSELPIVPIP